MGEMEGPVSASQPFRRQVFRAGAEHRAACLCVREEIDWSLA